MRTKFGFRLLAVLAVLAFVVVACTDDEGEETTTTAAGTTSEATTTTGAETTTTAGGEETTTTAPPAGGFTYRTAIFEDIITDNMWNYLGPGSSVYTAFVLGNTKPSLFSVNYPGLELDYGVAASADPGVATADGDGFSVTVAMREDAVWSDGSPITAHDIVFTAETARDFVLGQNWATQYPYAPIDEATGEVSTEVLGLTAVEAVDDYTVKFTWNLQPGLAVWPFQVGTAVIMSEAAWGGVVEEARASDDPAEALYAASGADYDVSGGSMMFDSWEVGAYVRNLPNPNYFDAGREYTSGGVTYTEGPYLSEQIFSIYGDQSAAVLALRSDEVDFLYNSLGLQRGLLDQVTSDANLTAIVNPTNGYRYLAFNLRKDPMAREGFRDAVEYMLDKEYITGSVLQGVAFPLYSHVPEGNIAWYDAEVAGTFRDSIVNHTEETRWDGEPFVDADGNTYVAEGMEARVHAAVKALMADGFSWPEGQVPDYADNAVVPGSGIMLDGVPVTDELTILSPGPGYDPLRATFSLFIAQAVSDLGFNAKAYPTDFNVLVNAVFVPTEEGTLDFDMFLLGWSLGDPSYPSFYESFFASKNDTLVNDGSNNTGFADPEFDALIEQYNVTQTIDEGRELVSQMEAILFDQKPYIVLFETGIIEAYRSAAIQYPFTDTLSGLQFINGAPALVRAAD